MPENEQTVLSELNSLITAIERDLQALKERLATWKERARVAELALARAQEERGDTIHERNETRQALKKIAATVETYKAMTNNGQDDNGRMQIAAWHDCTRIASQALKPK